MELIEAYRLQEGETVSFPNGNEAMINKVLLNEEPGFCWVEFEGGLTLRYGANELVCLA